MTSAPTAEPPPAVAPARHAVDYDQWFERPWGRYAFAVESAAIARAAHAVPSGLLLDAGCGTGRFTMHVADQHATSVGVDLDPDMLRLATPRFAGRCARASVDALPFPDETFDTVLAVTVLEFVADPAAALAEIARVTRRGGRVVVGALNPHSPWGLANRSRLRSGVWCDANFLGCQDLRALAFPYGRVQMHAALYAPGTIPGLTVLGPALETMGRLVPRWGAFQVLTITKDGAP